MARDDPQINIRIPQELKDQIEKAKEESGRSMNAEIVRRLELTFEYERQLAEQGFTEEKVYSFASYLDERFDRYQKQLDDIAKFIAEREAAMGKDNPPEES